MTPEPAKPPGLDRLRRALTWVGWVGLALVLAAAALLGFALSRGVHCPGCDRLKLGAEFAWWSGYFNVLFSLEIGGGALGLVALPLARRRMPAVVALAGAILLILLMPG